MRDSLRSLAAAGKTVFVSSPMLSEVQQLADVVGIVARGRLVREGRIEDLLREEASVRIRVDEAELATAGPLLEQAAGPGLVSVGPGPEQGWLEVRVDPARAAELNRALAAAGVYASRLEAGTTLEARFLELTRTAPDVGGPGAPNPAEPFVPGWPT
jgi:ABC-2 type transport system ATP-binding protein